MSTKLESISPAQYFAKAMEEVGIDINDISATASANKKKKSSNDKRRNSSTKRKGGNNKQRGQRSSNKSQHRNNSLSSTDDSPCLLYTSPSPRDRQKSRMPSSA